MSSKKVFFVMLGVLGLMGILVIAAVVVGDSFLRKQSAQLVNLKLDDQVIEAQQVALTQAKKDVETYSELEAIAKQVVPQDKDQARATREIVSLAEQSSIRIASIDFPASTLGQAPVAPTKPAEGEAPAPQAATPVTPSVTQVEPVEGIPNLFQLELNVVSDTKIPITYNQLIDFLDRLEKNRRTAHVSQITIQPDTNNRNLLNFSLTLTLYIKP